MKLKPTKGILFVAATCIGSGMMALPITLAKIGLAPSILIMLALWSVVYYTALVSVELNLQAGKGLSLGALSAFFSYKKLSIVADILLKLLSYSLLALYISVGASVLSEIAGTGDLVTLYTVALLTILLLPANSVKQINSVLFIALLVVIGLFIFFLASSVEWNDIPLLEAGGASEISSWTVVIPVAFTSFGFQVIFHTLADHYKCDAKILKKVFFWGTLIPTVVYITWISVVLGAIYNHAPNFYNQMLRGYVTVGSLVTELSLIAKSKSVQLLTKWLAFLAIVTSAIGIGLGLVGTIAYQLRASSHSEKIRHWLAAVIAVLPPYIVVTLFPGAFISILGFAGMILSLIAIVLPVYLLTSVRNSALHYNELANRPLLILSFCVGILIVVCGLAI